MRKGAGMASHRQPLRVGTLAMMLMLPLTLANDPGMNPMHPIRKIYPSRLIDLVRDEFMHFTHADGWTLSQCNIDKNLCVGQCYDGAAVMSGSKSGVQQKFKKDVPQALYIHCHAHRLNLVLADVVRNVEAAAEFLKPYKCCTTFSPTLSPMICSSKNRERLIQRHSPLNLRAYPTHAGPVNMQRWWQSENHCLQYGRHCWISCLSLMRGGKLRPGL